MEIRMRNNKKNGQAAGQIGTGRDTKQIVLYLTWPNISITDSLTWALFVISTLTLHYNTMLQRKLAKYMYQQKYSWQAVPWHQNLAWDQVMDLFSFSGHIQYALESLCISCSGCRCFIVEYICSWAFQQENIFAVCRQYAILSQCYRLLESLNGDFWYRPVPVRVNLVVFHALQSWCGDQTWQLIISVISYC